MHQLPLVQRGEGVCASLRRPRNLSIRGVDGPSLLLCSRLQVRAQKQEMQGWEAVREVPPVPLVTLHAIKADDAPMSQARLSPTASVEQMGHSGWVVHRFAREQG